MICEKRKNCNPFNVITLHGSKTSFKIVDVFRTIKLMYIPSNVLREFLGIEPHFLVLMVRQVSIGVASFFFSLSNIFPNNVGLLLGYWYSWKLIFINIPKDIFSDLLKSIGLYIYIYIYIYISFSNLRTIVEIFLSNVLSIAEMTLLVYVVIDFVLMVLVDAHLMDF